MRGRSGSGGAQLGKRHVQTAVQRVQVQSCCEDAVRATGLPLHLSRKPVAYSICLIMHSPNGRSLNRLNSDFSADMGESHVSVRESKNCEIALNTCCFDLTMQRRDKRRSIDPFRNDSLGDPTTPRLPSKRLVATPPRPNLPSCNPFLCATCPACFWLLALASTRPFRHHGSVCVI